MRCSNPSFVLPHGWVMLDKPQAYVLHLRQKTKLEFKHRMLSDAMWKGDLDLLLPGVFVWEKCRELVTSRVGDARMISYDARSKNLMAITVCRLTNTLYDPIGFIKFTPPPPCF